MGSHIGGPVLRPIHLMRALVSVAVGSLFAAALVIPGVATAATGDYFNPLFSPLPWSQPQTATVIDYEIYGNVVSDFEYAVPLTRGKAYRFTSTSQDSDAYLAIDAAWAPTAVFSRLVSNTVQSATVIAQKSIVYWVSFQGSSGDTFSVGATEVPAPTYRFASLRLPTSRPKRNVAFTVKATLSTSYDGLYSPVVFVVEKRDGSKYRKVGHAWAASFYTDSIENKFLRRTLKLAKGTHYIHAKLSDPAHATAVVSMRRKIHVR